MFVIGGSLKRREKISARLGDILSMLRPDSDTPIPGRDRRKQPVESSLHGHRRFSSG